MSEVAPDTEQPQAPPSDPAATVAPQSEVSATLDGSTASAPSEAAPPAAPESAPSESDTPAPSPEPVQAPAESVEAPSALPEPVVDMSVPALLLRLVVATEGLERHVHELRRMIPASAPRLRD